MSIVEDGKTAVSKILKTIGNTPVNAFLGETFKDELYSTFSSFNDEYDVSFLIALLDYFPVDKVSISTGSYDQYLYDLQKTVIDNYENGNYQVSYFYAHLIFMSYVYYCVERAYHLRPERMKDVFFPINSYAGREDKPDIENYRSVYEFSKIPEKEIFKVFRVIGMDNRQIKELSSYISKRDNFAHATGEGNISEDALIQNVKTITGNMASLHSLFLSDLKSRYIQYLLDYHEEDYSTVYDSIFDFIMDNTMSLADIEYLCSIGISGIRNENEDFKEKYRFVKKVHSTFIEYCSENYGIKLPANYLDLRNEAFLYYKYANRANEYVDSELGVSPHLHTDIGEVELIQECINCGENQFVFDPIHKKFHCFACNTDYSEEEISLCSYCGRYMLTNELNMCDDCVAQKTEE